MRQSLRATFRWVIEAASLGIALCSTGCIGLALFGTSNINKKYMVGATLLGDRPLVMSSEDLRGKVGVLTGEKIRSRWGDPDLVETRDDSTYWVYKRRRWSGAIIFLGLP